MKTAENYRGFLWNESTMVYLLIVNGFPHFFLKQSSKLSVMLVCIYVSTHVYVHQYISGKHAEMVFYLFALS